MRAAYLARDADRADVEAATAFGPRCRRELDAAVGEPPTPRLVRVRRLSAQACGALRAWSESVVASLEGDPGPATERSEREQVRADHFLTLAHRAVRRLVGDDRPLPVRRGASPESHVAPAYGRAASLLAHRPVEARCWSEDDWAEVVRVVSALDPEHAVDYGGIAAPDEARVSLAPWVCTALGRLVHQKARPHGDDAVVAAAAVSTLAHEAVHVRAPGLPEAEVECYALQELRRVGRVLGLGAAYADRLADLAWEEVYRENPPEYRSPQCRNGGALDVRPRSAAWP